MRDATRGRLELLYPEVAARASQLLRELKAEGTSLIVTEGLRPFSRQEALYAQGRTDMTKPKVTNARPGKSLHHYGLAVDVAFDSTVPYPKERYFWDPFIKKAEELGFKSLASMGDFPHIQMTFGLAPVVIEAEYLKNGLAGVWAMLDRKREVLVGVDWALRLKKAEEYLGVLKV